MAEQDSGSPESIIVTDFTLESIKENNLLTRFPCHFPVAIIISSASSQKDFVWSIFVSVSHERTSAKINFPNLLNASSSETKPVATKISLDVLGHGIWSNDDLILYLIDNPEPPKRRHTFFIL